MKNWNPQVHEGAGKTASVDFDAVTPTLLSDAPQAIVDILLDLLRAGVSQAGLAGVVAYAAARRIAHFHTSNEFNDWDTALHTFTFANAVHQGLQRIESIDLLRGVFDGAMSIYLDRFLNVPSVKIPQPEPTDNPDSLLDELEAMLSLQQQVNQAGDTCRAISREWWFTSKADGKDRVSIITRRPQLPYGSMCRNCF